MKNNYFEYSRAIVKEKAKIQRILNLQDALFSMLMASVAAFCFGVSGFVFKIVYELSFPQGLFGEDDPQFVYWRSADEQ